MVPLLLPFPSLFRTQSAFPAMSVLTSTTTCEAYRRPSAEPPYDPSEYDGVAPDRLTVVPKLVYVLFYRYLTLASYAAFLVLLCLALFGAVPAARANRTTAVMWLLWLVGNLVRRSSTLVGMPGRHTYRQTPVTVLRQLPRTLRGGVYVGGVLCELVLLPLPLYVFHFCRVPVVSFLGLLFYPPRAAHTVAALAALLFVLPLVGLAALGVLVLFVCVVDACDPYWWTSKEFGRLLKASCGLGVLLLVPTCTTLTSSFPCDGDAMRFAPTQRCMSVPHRLLMAYSAAVLCVYTAVLEMGLGCAWALGDGEAASYKEEPRISCTFLNWKLWMRSAALFLVIYDCSVVAALGAVVVLLMPISNVKSVSTVERISHLWTAGCFGLCGLFSLYNSAVPWIILLVVHLLFSLCVCACALLKVPFLGRRFNVLQTTDCENVIVESIMDL
ncbi:hypothetical protein STCU_10056 [Strigomonas culicis]|uniref:Transmembrane protein n=1 Tax=Strigomonas culicis TaxID=28005 RepID=S9TNM2_9TRYP|nr:hypothetical protein STCU_10056 [Strigomonas culicis]|eukprot:EPY18319.1 hypothetical protein STCU_10056 [Strigomonas culicis]